MSFPNPVQPSLFPAYGASIALDGRDGDVFLRVTIGEASHPSESGESYLTYLGVTGADLAQAIADFLEAAPGSSGTATKYYQAVENTVL